MKEEIEIIPYPKIKHINIFLNRITYRANHIHNDYEILCVVDGHGRMLVKNEEFKLTKGSVMIINRNEAHEIDAASDGVCVLIFQFSAHFLRDYYNGTASIMFGTTDISGLCGQLGIYNKIISLSQAYLMEDSFFRLECISKAADILYCLLKNTPLSMLTDKEYRAAHKRRKRMNTVLEYINDNYQGPVRLEEIASLENISPEHMSHFFTQAFGITFQEYLNNIRLEHAMRIMGNTRLSLSDIAAESGFSDPKYLSKAFAKKMNCSISSYRKAKITAAVISDEPCRNVLEYRYPSAESLEILSREEC